MPSAHRLSSVQVRPTSIWPSASEIYFDLDGAAVRAGRLSGCRRGAGRPGRRGSCGLQCGEARAGEADGARTGLRCGEADWARTGLRPSSLCCAVRLSCGRRGSRWRGRREQLTERNARTRLLVYAHHANHVCAAGASTGSCAPPWHRFIGELGKIGGD